MNTSITIKLIDGTRKEGTATDEHASSSYGLPVVLVDGIAYGTVDIYCSGMQILCGDGTTASLLRRAGYSVKRQIDRLAAPSVAIASGIALTMITEFWTLFEDNDNRAFIDPACGWDGEEILWDDTEGYCFADGGGAVYAMSFVDVEAEGIPLDVISALKAHDNGQEEEDS